MKKVLEIAKGFVQLLRENLDGSKSQIRNFRIFQYFRVWKTIYLNKKDTQTRLIKLDNFGKFLILRFFQVNLSPVILQRWKHEYSLLYREKYTYHKMVVIFMIKNAFKKFRRICNHRNYLELTLQIKCSEDFIRGLI